MPEKKSKRQAPPIDLDLSTHVRDTPPSKDMKRFDLFLVDTGWNVPVSKAVRSHLPLVIEYQRQDSLYLLSPAQSIEIVKKAPELIGHDPALIVYDLYANTASPPAKFHGFRLCLGRFRNPEQALTRLHEFLRFLILHRTAEALDVEVRRELHREGLKGMIKVIREASSELL
jgi:hypothetical protein